MVVQWAEDEKLRRATHERILDAVRRFDPDVVVAHSLGSLVAYDAFARSADRELMQGRSSSRWARRSDTPSCAAASAAASCRSTRAPGTTSTTCTTTRSPRPSVSRPRASARSIPSSTSPASSTTTRSSQGVISQGAFTWSLARLLRNRRKRGQKPPSWTALVAAIGETLEELDYDQRPALVGPAKVLAARVPWR